MPLLWAYRRGVRHCCALALAAVLGLTMVSCSTSSHKPLGPAPGQGTATPIHHLVVVFQENVSFDHYFGTYPSAANVDGQRFTARPGTPQVDGLTPELLTHNPNRAQATRLGGPRQQVVCDQDHEYTAEQEAFHGGAMDQFVEHTETATCKPPMFTAPGMVMDYYDGNSVTALWNYAQHFAMSDNSYNTTFGPSTPGAVNLISGQNHGVTTEFMPNGKFPIGDVIENAGDGQGTVIGDAQPFGDDCSNRDQVQLSADNKNIGDLLDAKGITWGFFEGGFKPTESKPDGTAVCGA
ncbi:MAG: phospholipase, partial [Mycobacterium sp.]|nr:phospholipase [Mycobacterium sp.]